MSDFMRLVDQALRERQYITTPENGNVSPDNGVFKYTRGCLTFTIQPNSWRELELNNGNRKYTGSHLSLLVEGLVPSLFTESYKSFHDKYFMTLAKFQDAINNRLREQGMEISILSRVPSRGDGFYVPNIRLAYREGTEPEIIAATVVDVHDELVQLIQTYVI